MLRVYVPMLLSDRVAGRAIAALDEQTIEISEGDAITRVVFDPQTGLPAKLLYDIRPERQPPIFVEEEYSDFRDIGGLKIPFAVTVKRNGLKHSDGALSDYKVNQGLKLEILQRRP
jgi:hypothetical protein